MEDILNYLKLDESIATAGQPTEIQLASVKAAGYRSIINLAPGTHENTLSNEREVVELLGMEYIHIPVKFDCPMIEDFNHFCDVMQFREDRPIFVHCVANLRVSGFMYLYRRIYQGVSDEDARTDLVKCWIPNPVWQEFIDRVVALK